MRTYPFISNYLQSSGWELARLQVAVFNHVISNSQLGSHLSE